MNGARSETKREWAILDGMAIPSGFGENELLAYILTVWKPPKFEEREDKLLGVRVR